MRRPRRRLLATEEQQAEVLRRVDAGESYRAIALAVFGSAGAKNRVARIVQRRAEAWLEQELLAGDAEPPLVDESLSPEERLAALERIRANIEFVERQRKR